MLNRKTILMPFIIVLIISRSHNLTLGSWYSYCISLSNKYNEKMLVETKVHTQDNGWCYHWNSAGEDNIYRRLKLEPPWRILVRTLKLLRISCWRLLGLSYTSYRIWTKAWGGQKYCCIISVKNIITIWGGKNPVIETTWTGKLKNHYEG